jgi:hypothetical protein
MPYVNKKRPYKHEYEMQKKRDENPARMERQRARRALDKEGVNRKGMDVSHVKALSKGGGNGDGVTLQTPSENRSFKRTSKSGYKNPVDRPKGKKVYKV